MSLINANLDDRILKEFREVIYYRSGLKKGDFKKTLEDAIVDYILKYPKTCSSIDSAKLNPN